MDERAYLSKKEYIFWHFTFAVVCGFFVFNVLPEIIPLFITYAEQSIFKLILCMIVPSVIGMLTCNNFKRRTYVGMISDVVLGIALYLLVIFGEYLNSASCFLISGTLALSGICFIVFIVRKFKKKKFRRVAMKTVYGGALTLRNIMAFMSVAAIILIPVSLNAMDANKMYSIYYTQRGITYYKNDDFKINAVYGNEYSLEENIDIIKHIRHNEDWTSLSFEEREQVIRAIVECECRYLGIPFYVDIEFSDDMSDTTLGLYLHKDRKVSFNKDLVMSVNINNEKMLSAILHELRHAYQYSVMELVKNLSPEQRNLLIFRDIGGGECVFDLMENTTYYFSGDSVSTEEYLYYILQPIEKDAFSYGREGVQNYFNEIDLILNEE